MRRIKKQPSDISKSERVCRPGDLDSGENACERVERVSYAADITRTAYLQSFVKRLIDVGVAMTCLTVLGPLFIGVAIVVKATSKGSIFFTQTRLTRFGVPFKLYKFRSMRTGAEGETGAVFAERSDARITKIGGFLRKTRLDELPQLWNVLKGDMSLIGPRPERPEIAGDLGKKIKGFEHRLKVKAGLTGLAQVIQGYPDGISGYRRKLGLDRLYIRRQNLLFDLWILYRTVGIVLTGSGAR